MSKEKLILADATRQAGFRELFAIKHGHKRTMFMGGKEYLKFTYSPDIKYQDANGALFSVSEGRWVG